MSIKFGIPDYVAATRQDKREGECAGGTAQVRRLGSACLLRVHRSHKPVFLNGDIRRSFVRIGGSDIRCSDNERNRFLMDAATERYDGQSVDLNLNGTRLGEH